MPLHIANKAIMKGEIPPERPPPAGAALRLATRQRAVRNSGKSHGAGEFTRQAQWPCMRHRMGAGSLDGAMLCCGPHGHLNPYDTAGNFTFCP
jgi:hypothetical protein